MCVLSSLFVLLKGATKEQAFKIGHEIAEAVTASNPKPVKLKFEKVEALTHTPHRNTQSKPLTSIHGLIDLIYPCVSRCTCPVCSRLRSAM